MGKKKFQNSVGRLKNYNSLVNHGRGGGETQNLLEENP